MSEQKLIPFPRNLKIKFSHDYPKLWGQTVGYLMAVEKIFYEDIMQDLIEYDTKINDGEYYKLYGNEFLILYFRGEKLIPFCTIRPYNKEKEEYYRSNINRWFDIIIKRG